MKVTKLQIEGLILFQPNVYRDHRGYFQETFHLRDYTQYLPEGVEFIQDNLSYSVKGTIRGLHYQKEPFTQAKLVRCVQGRVLDVVVDIRVSSPDFGKYITVELDSIDNAQLFIPKGFAHGFSVLSEVAILEYKCDEYYHPESDSGIRFDDKILNIDWLIPQENQVISEKDKNLPSLKEILEVLGKM